MLTDEQKACVAQWFSEGASLDEIQKRLKDELGVHITYLDLRLLVADLPQPGEGTAPAEETQGTQETQTTEGTEASAPACDAAAPQTEAPKRYDLDAPDADEGAATPDVAVEVDALMIPGTIASGSVTFSDGTAGKWYLDQMGRLGLSGVPQGYRPSPTDAALFQSRLLEALRAKGLA